MQMAGKFLLANALQVLYLRTMDMDHWNMYQSLMDSMAQLQAQFDSGSGEGAPRDFVVELTDFSFPQRSETPFCGELLRLHPLRLFFVFACARACVGVFEYLCTCMCVCVSE